MGKEIETYTFIVKGKGVKGGSFRKFLENIYEISIRHSYNYPDKHKDTTIDVYVYKVAHRTNLYAIVIKNAYKEIINDVRDELTHEGYFNKIPATTIIAEGNISLNPELWKPLE